MTEVKKHLAPCEFYNDEDIRKVISKRIESLKHHRADIRAAMYVSNFGGPVKKTTRKASKEESFVLDKKMRTIGKLQKTKKLVKFKNIKTQMRLKRNVFYSSANSNNGHILQI